MLSPPRTFSGGGDLLAAATARRSWPVACFEQRSPQPRRFPHDLRPAPHRREIDNLVRSQLSGICVPDPLDRSNPMNCCYAIVPDGSLEPVALFEALEDAMDWGLKRF